MSDLEVKSKELIVDLARSNRSIDSLGFDERIELSRWACKTAYVLNFDSNFEKNIPQAHRDKIINGDSLAFGVAVYSMQNKRCEEVSWFQTSSWRVETLSKSKESLIGVSEIQKNSYKVCIQIKNLFLVVVYWDDRNWHYVFDRERVMPLDDRSSASYSRVDLSREQDLDSSNESDAVVRFEFMKNIGVVQMSKPLIFLDP